MMGCGLVRSNANRVTFLGMNGVPFYWIGILWERLSISLEKKSSIIPFRRWNVCPRFSWKAVYQIKQKSCFWKQKLASQHARGSLICSNHSGALSRVCETIQDGLWQSEFKGRTSEDKLWAKDCSFWKSIGRQPCFFLTLSY